MTYDQILRSSRSINEREINLCFSDYKLGGQRHNRTNFGNQKSCDWLELDEHERKICYAAFSQLGTDATERAATFR